MDSALMPMPESIISIMSLPLTKIGFSSSNLFVRDLMNMEDKSFLFWLEAKIPTFEPKSYSLLHSLMILVEHGESH